MTTGLLTAKRWNDENILNKNLQDLLDDWLKVDHEGDSKAGLRVINSIVKCKRDLFSVRAWLQHAFQPRRLAADYETVKIYLNFFSKLRIKGNDALQYLNDERRKRELSQYLDLAHIRIVQQPVRRLIPDVRFTKNKPVDRGLVEHGEMAGSKGDRPSSACPSVELQPKTQSLEVTLQLDELGSSAISEELAEMTITEEMVVSAKIDPQDETLLSQNFQDLHVDDETPDLQDCFPLDASHDADAEISKRKGLDHDMRAVSHFRDVPPDPVGCEGQTLVDQIPSDDAGRTTKRRKVDRSIATDYESHSPPSKRSVSNAVPCTPQRKRGKPFVTPQAKKPNKKDTKQKKPVRSFQSKKVGTETHPLQGSGILDVCCHPSSNHDHMDIPDAPHLVIAESEGRQQAQDSHPVNDDLGLVTMKGGQLDSKPQPSMAVLNVEGPREMSPCHMNGVSMEDSQYPTSSNMGLHSNFADNSDTTVQSPLKHALHRLPPIWAESRQEVCEAFDWFRSYQGGVYHAENTVKGYLLGAFASRRDVFEKDGRVIISHGGGKSESIGSQRGLFVSHQASDQLADDKSVRALLDNYRSGRPLVLIVDDKYALFPYDLSSRGVTYAVLGFYSIVYAWAEFQPAKNEVGRVIRFKFAFRWCEEQGTPWWCFADNTGSISKELSNNKGKASGVPRIVSEHDFSRNSLLPISNPQMPRVCSLCRSFSQKVYSTWVCLMPDCEMFWRNPETQEYVPDNLQYDKQFIALLPRLPLPFALNLVPETTVTRAMNGTSTSYAFTRGIHCPNCGRLSSRYQWEQLECRACKWTKKADIDIRNAKDFWCDRLPISYEYFHMSPVSDFIPEPIRTFRHESGRGAIQTFTLPYNRGFIHHIRTPCATAMLDADQIFKHYQEEAKSGKLRFRRWPLKAHKCRGTLLTNYFSHNAGEPYQYVGSDANSVPFEQVPAVIEARQFIQDRILQALDKVSEFNEVLSCAYMERQKMAFHSDAEVGLGPLVAGLSLGSPALMHFRIVARHDPLYEQRGVLLTVVLRHGDILVMDGTGVQEYYEHTVVPNNFRIAATARQITPKHHGPEKPSVISHLDTVKDDGGI